METKKASYIPGNRTFQPKPSKIKKKTTTPQKIPYISGNGTSNSKIKKFLIFSQKKAFRVFSQKKPLTLSGLSLQNFP